MMMTLSKQDSDALHRLLCEIWDRGPSANRFGRLESLAKQMGKPAYKEIVLYTSLHAEITTSMSSARAYEAGVSAIMEDSSPSSLHEPTADNLHTPITSSALLTLSSKKRIRALTWLIAAGLLLAVGLGVFWQSSLTVDGIQHTVAIRELFRPAQPVATVFENGDAVWANAYDVDSDKTLMQGQILTLEQGSARVSMACGADIVLQSPCTVKLIADDLVELRSGKLTAQAAAWATGFVIETKGLRITDLGTKFAVSVDGKGVSEAHVLEGSVLAEPLKSVRPKRSSMLLKKGEAIRVDLPQSTIDLIAAKSSNFIDYLPKFRPFKPIRIWNTGMSGAVGQQDLHWMITAGIAKNGPYPRPAVITKREVYLDNMPDASQWISLDLEPMAAPDSVHTFETRFDLAGYDLDTVCMVGLFLADDAVTSLSINSTSIPFKPWVPRWHAPDFQKFRAIVIDKGFVPGENVISIDLYNFSNEPDRPAPLNPMGLRVEWQAFGCENLQ